VPEKKRVAPETTGEWESFQIIRDWTGGRFTVLLFSLIFFVVVDPLLPSSFWFRVGSECVLGVLALSAIFDIARSRALIIVLGILALSMVFGQTGTLVAPNSDFGAMISAVVNALFFAFAFYRTGVHVFTARIVTAETFRGAIAMYLLIGLMWTSAYMALELGHPVTFNFPSVQTSGHIPNVNPHFELRRNLHYFSFVTLSTLGYGDITPHTGIAKSLAWLEAIAGQLFVAMTIARLVAIHTAQTMSSSETR